MSDKILDTSQLINGIAVLLSFFVGYKYALKKHAPHIAEKTQDPTKIFADEMVSNNYKMVLVVRNDLQMGKGKIAAQCGHAAVGAYQTAVQKIPRTVTRWENTGCCKVAVKVQSEKELMTINKAAKMANLNTCIIRDAGRTQIEPNTKTVLAVGPAAAEDVDKITGHLKLL